MLKLKTIFNLFILLTLSLFFCGCATLTYVGNDINSDNIQTVKTQEDFVFNTYKKSLDNINVKIGISRTPVAELLALYIQIENLSYETPYNFMVEDLRISNPENDLQFITSNNYLNIYQGQESASMSALGMMSSTLATMTGMNSNYTDYNQSTIQTSNEKMNQSAYSRIEQIGDQILKHTVKYSSTISPRRSQYYYFFFEDTEKFPINVKYKTLNYQFKL